MQKTKYLVLLSFFFSACSPFSSSLETLGMHSDFSDVEIEDDFLAPEEDPMMGQISNDEMMQVEEILPSPNPEVGVPGVSLNLKNTFDMGTQLFSLAHGNAYRWEGCNQEKMSQGGYNSDSQCGRGFFHPSFADNLNDAFFQCVSDAASAAGYAQPHRVFIRHLGTYNDRNARNSSRLSNHALARAWDIVNFNLYDQNGNLTRVSTLKRDYVGAQAVFYDEFRDCWKESLPSQCSPGKTEYKGSIGHTSSKLGGNSLHNDHIHLSFPVCAG